MKKMNVKQAIKNASKAALKYKDGKPKKEKDLPEVTVSKNIFKGPLAKMKAKKAIKSGAFDTAFAKKRGLGGKEKVIKYSDSGTAVDPTLLAKYDMGTNKPLLMKKTVTSSAERLSERNKRNRNTE